jgi:hypothetical protein
MFPQFKFPHKAARLGLLFLAASLSACGTLEVGVETTPGSGYTDYQDTPAVQTAVQTALPTTTPEPEPATGLVNGKICFPSEGIPPMQLFFQNAGTGAVVTLDTTENQSTFQVELLAGDYVAFAHTQNGQLRGSYSQMVLCGLLASCTDHSLVTFTVTAGQTTENIDICDWYASDSVPDVPLNLLLNGLVYDSNQGLWMLSAARGARLLTSEYNAVISWDATRLLYVHANDEAEDIWLMDLATGDSRQLTDTPDRLERGYQWWQANPDIIVFNYIPSEKLGPWSGYLGAYNLATDEYLILDGETGSNTNFALSPDGKTIAYDGGLLPILYRFGEGVSVFDTTTYGFQANRFYSPAFSPDGSQLAWMAIQTLYSDSPQISLVIFDLQSTTYRQYHSYTPQGGSELFGQITWSPDGQWLTFVTQAEQGSRVSMWVIKADGSQEQSLGNASGAVWSPDSRYLLYFQWPGPGSDQNPLVLMLEVGGWSTRQLDLLQPSSLSVWLDLP